MARWIFKDVKQIATKYGLTLTRVGGRYRLTPHNGGNTDICNNLSEVLVYIGAYGAKHRAPKEVVDDLFNLIHSH